ncbi:hypothetical protein HNQ99_000684 [Rhizorhapis suberifaciens]|uniref:Uncharacterized protein n=1 Tax=Rhizorhapis suberifaciens TaxID=13656 RepID=A0A840HS94_9SPHN|nr:hypothetical protein [Rhizorhapis suberifaciens]
MIAPVPHKGLEWECGAEALASKSAAVPATVSGERDAHRSFFKKGQPLGCGMKMLILGRPCIKL